MTAAPLAGLRIVTLADDALPSLGKSFVDLGADVQVLRADGASDSARPLRDLLESRGKRFSTVPDDPSAARTQLADRLGGADALIVTPAAAAACGFADIMQIAEEHPHLVIAVLTDFGLTGERAGWIGTEAVYKALSGTLSRSGEPGRPPLLQPGEIFTRSAAQQIVWAIMVAVYRSFTGAQRPGAVLDCSIFECGAVCLDPSYGMSGSGTPDLLDASDRPDAAHLYPIYRVRDGYVRVCVLAKGQWLSLLDWMGSPAPLLGDELLTNPGRLAHADLILPMLRDFFARMTCAELVQQCRQRRIPAAAVLSLGDVLDEEHFQHAGLLTDVGRLDGRSVIAAEGMACINGRRTVPRSPSDDEPAVGWQLPGSGASGRYPLSGLTVLDLGVIVAGAVVGELFAEQGARVIRVENTNFPDGMRRSFDSVTPALARGHRGKESVGLDLRSELGRELFYELVRRADIVTSNFKPGTVERLGISYDELLTINPRVVCVETSAFGDTGPWRTAMGYGPLVRAATGQTWLWRANADSDYFADGITIYPDHLVGRVCAVAALACLLDRIRTGRAAHVTVAQSDVALVQLAELLATESVAPGAARPPGDVATHLLDQIVLQAAGADEWCIVDPQTPEQLATLRRVLGVPTGSDPAEQLAGFVRERSAEKVARELQAAGVPAGAMRRIPELPDDPGIRSRNLYEITQVMGTPEQVLVERYPIRSEQLRVPQLAAMPMFGAQTRTVLAELGRTPEQIERLVADGIAQESPQVHRD